MRSPRHRFTLSFAIVASFAATAAAQPTTRPNKAPPALAVLPAPGEPLELTGTPSWPKLDWLYDVPAPSDAAGKIVIHWFCAPKIAACPDDLARIVTLKEGGKVYIVAYINGTKAQAQKLDPIRDSEGVGRGTLAYGRGATKLMRDLGLTGPASLVVGVDGKILAVTSGPAPGDLDGCGAKVTAALAAIKDYVSSSDGPTVVKPG